MQLHYVIRKQVSRVDLHKDGTTSIGIVLKDGGKTESRPIIKAIKKGSVAYRSHCVSERDAIVSVCGQDARGMSRRDFKHLLREAESKIELELEYQIQEACLNKCGVYRMERIYLKLKKEADSFGFVLRKCGFRHPATPGYPIISNLKDGGPADRDGRLKSGDRLLKIDEQDLELLSLPQIAGILQTKDEATFTIEYKIALIENSQVKLGERTVLEIDCLKADLGLVLGSSGSRIIIEEIQKGSLADRCGAFRIGDDILAINDIDVTFLSTSKANSLLRNFKKEPGRLVLVANVERLPRPRQNPCLPRKRIKPFFKTMPLQLTPERDQQVPSSNHLLVPCNSPQSLFGGNLEDNNRLSDEGDYYNTQIKTIAKLREIIKSIVTMENYISSSTSNRINDSVDNLDEIENNNRCGNLVHLKVLSARIKNLSHSLAIHLVKNAQLAPNFLSENNPHSINGFKENPQSLKQKLIAQDLMENIVEIYTNKLISRENFEKLQSRINQVNLNCKKCSDSLVLAALTIQKILLIFSLDNKIEHNCFLIKTFIEDVLRFDPCKDCRLGSGSQTGSEISRNTNQLSSLDHLKIKTFRLTHPLNKNTSRSLVTAGSDIPNITDVNRLYHLQSKSSSSAPLFSSETEFKSPRSVDDGSSTNGTTLKSFSHEAVLDFNCKTKANNLTQLSHCYEKPCPKDSKAMDHGSLSFAAPSCQSQSEVKMAHNSSLGFATPNVCPAFYDRESISGDSSSQPSIRAPNNSQNTSFSYDTELLPCKDNDDYSQNNGNKNYSSNIHKKILRGKGLLKAQRQNCKSVDNIADSDNELPKHSNSKILKHLSEPQFLSKECQSPTGRVPRGDKKALHLYAKVESLETKREMDNANRYWSPFQRSDCNDRPNMLDIPNWSVKSSHSLQLTDQVSKERTMQETMDVTLKNEGKGYGLSIGFPSSPSEDSTQVPRITAVSSQGAAHKIGILLKGDRILAINNQNTTSMTIPEFENLKEEAFSADEVLLTVQFDVIVRNLQFGTFNVCVNKTSKTGLIYHDFNKGSPLVVKGIVKGSPAHRCGLLFPGDEVLSANNVRQEFYEVFTNTCERSEYVTIRVRRNTSEEKYGDGMNLDQEVLPPKTYDLSKTSIHSNHDDNKMFLEQELTLYRDPVAKDFGFLIGQDQFSKMIYVTDLRPDGPADCSKVIRKNDIILQVNGVDLEAHKDGPIASLFHPTGNRLELKTRRILRYE